MINRCLILAIVSASESEEKAFLNRSLQLASESFSVGMQSMDSAPESLEMLGAQQALLEKSPPSAKRSLVYEIIENCGRVLSLAHTTAMHAKD